MTSDKPNITLYQQAKAGLKSLFVQTAQVSIGLIIMLLATGGNPPGWLVSTSFFFGVSFVAWSENKRQSEFESQRKNYSNNSQEYKPLNISLKETKVSFSASLQDNRSVIDYDYLIDYWLKVKVTSETSDKPINISKRQRYDQDQYHRLQEGVDVWNHWKQKNPDIKPTLKNADFSGANLSGVNLKDADLSGANLNNTNLSSADLHNASLWNANLRGANLEGADLNGADLSGTKLISANLKDSNLYNADLIIANLSSANLSSANLSFAKLISAKLFSANLEGAKLFSANLEGAKIRGKANLINVDLRNANLSRANLEGANLEGANLIGTIVDQARFGNNLGIDDQLRQDLIKRGAIFVDSLEDQA